MLAATTPPRLATLVMLAALAVLSINLFLPSLPHIARDFGVDYGMAALSIAGYLATTAGLNLILGPLSDRYGRRPVLLVSLVVFTLSSIVCALAGDFTVFLAFRMLQGVVISGWVLSLAAIRDTMGPQEAAARIGYLAMAMAIAPMLGPMIGGGLDEFFGWRASFVAYAGCGAMALALAWCDMGETNKTPSRTLARQFRAYPVLLLSRRYWCYALCLACASGAFYTFLAGAPLAAKSELGLSPGQIGICLGTITAGFATGSFLSGRFAARFALTTMVIVGRLSSCFGLVLALALYFSGVVNVIALFGSVAFVGIGNGLSMPSANAGAMSVRPDLAGSAAGLIGTLNNGGGATLTALTAAAMATGGGLTTMLSIMLGLSVAGLLLALLARRLEAVATTA